MSLERHEHRLEKICTVKTKCPICTWESDQLYLREDRFKVIDKDIDLKPVAQWHDGGDCYPTIYYMWECPHCSFCGNKQMFRNPTGGSSMGLPLFRKQTLELYTHPSFRKVLHLLSEVPKTNELDFFQAVKRHYLAIYHLQQVEQFRESDCLPLARYHLHLSWLFRDMERWPLHRLVQDQLRKLYEILQPLWLKPPVNPVDSALRSLTYYERYFTNSSAEEEKGTEQQLIQLMGRINLYLGHVAAAEDLFSQALRIANDRCFELKKELKDPKHSSDKWTIMHRIHHLEHFADETSHLIAEAGNYALKSINEVVEEEL